MKNKDNTINTKTAQEKKHRFTLLIGATLISLVFFCMYIHANYINTNATYNSDTSSYVTVDEIWNAEEGFFDGERLATLLQYIVNDETMMTNTAKMQGSVVMCAGGNLSSADIRQSTANGKTNNQDVQVVFNGLTWQVVYLSSDQDGNDVLTLWLSSSQQDKWQGKTGGISHSFSASGDLTSNWAHDWCSDDTSGLYPSNMYSSSYIRVVTLNNGGSYATDASSATEYNQSSESVFAEFTMEQIEGSVTKFLVTPRKIDYQQTESAVEVINRDYLQPNDAYGQPTVGYWSESKFDYSTKPNYADWADDYLWLPSQTETGYSDSRLGIWQTSANQRQNDSNFSWLRSGQQYSSYFSCYLSSDGLSDGYTDTTFAGAVRPAIHLNLNAAANASRGSPIWDGVTTEGPMLQDITKQNSESNPFIIDCAAKLAWISETAQSAECYNKYYLQTVDINLNNHPWTPINNSGANRAYYYDGGGHTISNVYINTEEQSLSSNNNIGLFGYIYGSSSKHAYIKNLGITNSTISGKNSNHVGAVVGYAYQTDISNCYNQNTNITADKYVGGVVGVNDGTISNSYNAGTISGTYYVGGIAGQNLGTINNTHNTGIISGSYDVGGIVGDNSGNISNSYNETTVTGLQSQHIGGVAGWNNGTISNSYNIGTVNGPLAVGGIVGANNGTISNSYNTGTLSGTSRVGGVAGSNVGTISNSYNAGNITGTSDYIGGISGSNDRIITNSYNTGKVSGYQYVGGIAGISADNGTISNSYNTGATSGYQFVGGVVGYIKGSVSAPASISSCYSAGEIIRSSGSWTSFGGVVGYIENSTNSPSQYVSVSWCYYNKNTSGNVVTSAIGEGMGYQCYGLSTTEMQGTSPSMNLSSTWWNFASGQYPTLKYVVKA